jgi:hypothetical protein
MIGAKAEDNNVVTYYENTSGTKKYVAIII